MTDHHHHPLWRLLDKVYCINRDEQRWSRMKRRLDPLLPPGHLVRFTALTPEEDPRVSKVLPANESPIVRRTFASTLSHLDLWTQLQQQNRTQPTYSLLLEDDVFFRKDWMDVVYDFLTTASQLDPEWDMLQLNCAGFHDWQQGRRRAENLLLAGAYILSPRGVDYLIERFGALTPENAAVASDYRLCALQTRGHSYFYFPYLALQEFEDSLLAGFEQVHHQDHVKRLQAWQTQTYKPAFESLYDWI